MVPILGTDSTFKIVMDDFSSPERVLYCHTCPGLNFEFLLGSGEAHVLFCAREIGTIDRKYKSVTMPIFINITWTYGRVIFSGFTS